MTHFTSFHQLQHWLDARGLFHMELGLKRTDMALDRLGLRDPKFFVAHIVGTNGKGSTTAFLSSLCHEHGLNAGVYTSPHFLSIRERIRIGQRMLPESFWVQQANAVMQRTEDLGLTYFEFLTVLAIHMFKDGGITGNDIDLAVMEAGLGGTYDAVCSMRRDLLCLTPIGLDHQAVLGETIREIAQDKSGAMRPGMPVFCAAQQDEAAEVIAGRAANRKALLHMDLPQLPEGTRLLLAGPHQQDNARLALAAWNHISYSRNLAAQKNVQARALGKAFLPGRMQQANGVRTSAGPIDLLIDGAHNPPALTALTHALHTMEQVPDAVVFACLKDKDMQAMGPLVRSMTKGTIVVPRLEAQERTADPKQTAKAIGGDVTTAPDLATALEMAARSGDDFQARSARVLVCGSLYLLAEFYTLRPEFLGLDESVAVSRPPKSRTP
jgi:dihydrofolate synthase/folylpolyglutamate synthase